MGRERTLRRMRVGLALVILVVGAVSVATAVSGASSNRVHASAVDLTRLPLGDGKVSTSSASRGYVYACDNGNPNGGGAFTDGPWIDKSSGTFNEAAKTSVQGSVNWPQAKVKFALSHSGQLIVKGNGLPTNLNTGIFPIRASDPAYAYDRNPNSITAQSISYKLPKPKAAKKVGCLNGGPIGIALNGVPIFDALDAGHRDAVAHEVLDACQGHPQMQGQYHYHEEPDCIWSKEPTNKPSGLFGYALDGYPISGPRGAGGAFVTDAQLDKCHGKTSVVKIDGKRKRMYHYVATLEYPYTLGCFHGTPIRTGPPQP